MKILYLPIFEPGAFHEIAVCNKRGLYNSLVRAGHHVWDYDYLAHTDTLTDDLPSLVNEFKPDILLTQLHGADMITPDLLAQIRQHRPDMQIINWSGDSWRHSLTAPPILELLRHVDLQLVASPDALADYEREGIRAAFWQIAYEEPIDLPDMPDYDIVFLANVINEKRRELMEFLRSLPYSAGIYGDWEYANGHNTYDFGAGEMLYQKAHLAIADNNYADSQNYISNRPIQCLMAGGALLLHQHVEQMKLLSDGWKGGVHYIEWRDLGELRGLIDYWMQPEQDADRLKIVAAGKRHVAYYHTYDYRIRQLFEELLPEKIR